MSTRSAWFCRYFALVGLLVLASSVGVAAADATVWEPGSGVMQFAPEIQRSVDTMLARSPTFRDQYQRILNTPRLIVTARVDAVAETRSYRARSTIRRYASGLVIVLMEIAPGANQVQWIAHEFEHVMEQLDGINVDVAAARGSNGSWYSSGRMVETLRAVRAGRQVQDEIRRTKTRSDKVVEGTR
jgi:hypothetical protein